VRIPRDKYYQISKHNPFAFVEGLDDIARLSHRVKFFENLSSEGGIEFAVLQKSNRLSERDAVDKNRNQLRDESGPAF
jgi:hypothetical protein